MSTKKSEPPEKNYEKITVNLPLVDIGKIDYLTEHGHYNSRAEFIRVAVKNEISSHKYEFDTITRRFQGEESVRTNFVLGSLTIKRNYLEKLLKKGEKTKIFVIGYIRFAKDIDVDLIRQTVNSFKAYGIKRGSPGVIDFLENIQYIDED